MSRLWNRAVGGILPIVHRPQRDVHLFDGTTYRLRGGWLRISLTVELHAPWTPRKVRRAREADRARTNETTRRALAGEPPIQVGDQIPGWAPGFLGHAEEVRDCEHTLWKRAVGDERYAVEDGEVIRTQEYEWIAWSAGEYAGGHATDQGVLDHAPLTVLKIRDQTKGQDRT